MEEDLNPNDHSISNMSMLQKNVFKVVGFYILSNTVRELGTKIYIL